jgi:hypothetical protein
MARESSRAAGPGVPAPVSAGTYTGESQYSTPRKLDRSAELRKGDWFSPRETGMFVSRENRKMHQMSNFDYKFFGEKNAPGVPLPAGDAKPDNSHPAPVIPTGHAQVCDSRLCDWFPV